MALGSSYGIQTVGFQYQRSRCILDLSSRSASIRPLTNSHKDMETKKILSKLKMALILHSPSIFTTRKPRFHLPISPHRNLTKFSINCRQDSSTEKETASDSGASSRNSGDSAAGLGFGSSGAATAKQKKQKGKRERASIIRRTPVEKPSLATPQEAARAEELRKNDSAFLLAWLGLGAIILVEGITLAASGFLPEAWDEFFVKYLYPSFTPTVFLFIAGTVAYGVLKYLQNEKF